MVLFTVWMKILSVDFERYVILTVCTFISFYISDGIACRLDGNTLRMVILSRMVVHLEYLLFEIHLTHFKLRSKYLTHFYAFLFDTFNQ